MKNEKIKTVELDGALLDWAVAHAGKAWEGAHNMYPTMTLDPTFSRVSICEWGDGTSTCMLIPNNPMRQDPQNFCPSTDWRQGGEIIERNKIWITDDSEGNWQASVNGPCVSSKYNYWIGRTPLIAAMRAYVASELGDEVEVIGAWS